MADDIYDVTVESLKSPAAGISAVVRKIAEKARGDAAEAPPFTTSFVCHLDQ